MFFKKEGFPQVSEVVLCTVKKILHNSVFVSLDEYKEREGIIHISEIAPGRIRTIREYVREGKKIVCLILRVYQDRNHIELSLRRVTTSVRLKKNNELKLEQKSEKILELVAQGLEMPFQKFYQDIGLKIIHEHGSLHDCFVQLTEKPGLLDNLGIDKKISQKIVELAAARFKPPEVTLTKNMSVKCSSQSGVEVIKEAFREVLDEIKKKNYNVKFSYTGAPKYRFIVTAPDYKTAEAIVAEISSMIIKNVNEHDGEAELLK